mgnify:CR=1 FL=1
MKEAPDLQALFKEQWGGGRNQPGSQETPRASASLPPSHLAGRTLGRGSHGWLVGFSRVS